MSKDPLERIEAVMKASLGAVPCWVGWSAARVFIKFFAEYAYGVGYTDGVVAVSLATEDDSIAEAIEGVQVRVEENDAFGIGAIILGAYAMKLDPEQSAFMTLEKLTSTEAIGEALTQARKMIFDADSEELRKWAVAYEKTLVEAEVNQYLEKGT